MSPHQKADFVRELKTAGHVVAVVGDGVNDCVALALADLSVAMGGGADKARANSDGVLLDDRLELFTKAIDRSRESLGLMNQNLALIRVLAGGSMVAASAIVADTLKPKMFAGLFSAAPSVATASLLVSGLAMGPSKDALYARGMIAGAIGLVFYSLAAAFLVKHLKAVSGSMLAWIAWLIPAAVVYLVWLR